MTWDEIVTPYRWDPDPDLCNPDARFDAKRAERRTSGLFNQPSTSPARGPASTDAIADYRRRVRAWMTFASRLRNCDDYYRSTHSSIGTGADWSIALFIGRPLLMAAYGLGRAWGLTTVARLTATLRTGTCPRCRYVVSTQPPLQASSAPAFQREVLTPRCSECGGLWPLLPPPADCLDANT